MSSGCAPNLRNQVAQNASGCADPVPDLLAPAPSPPLELRILVLYDGPPPERAREVVATAAGYYEPVGLRLTAEVRELTGASSDDALALMDAARQMVGPAVPAWVHAVIVLTDRDLRAGMQDANGMVDCIGGIADPEHAFGVVQNFANENPGLGPIDNTENQTAKILAHEVGHLLAARHDHHNCFENAADQPTRVTPCTLMFLSGGIWGNAFGTLETQVMRTFAAQYVKPLPPVPAPSRAPDSGSSPPPPVTSAPAAPASPPTGVLQPGARPFATRAAR